jgi:glycosyltransferase involved in cell wall biosynthesis
MASPSHASVPSASTSTPPRVAVVIPAFNEEGAVRETVLQVRAALDGAAITHEIVVVNDGSSDGTPAEAQASGARVIDFADNRGYGHALKAGIRGSDAGLIAILDADGTYPPSALPAMVALAEGADMVVADRGRRMNNVPFIRRPAKWILKLLASVLARRRIHDVNSGMRVFRRRPLESFMPLLPDGYSFTTTITLCMLAANCTVLYHPIAYGRRIGHSKIRARHFFKFLFLVVRLTLIFQPLRIFMPAALLLLIVPLVDVAYRDGAPPARYALWSAGAGIALATIGWWADRFARVRLAEHGAAMTE